MPTIDELKRKKKKMLEVISGLEAEIAALNDDIKKIDKQIKELKSCSSKGNYVLDLITIYSNNWADDKSKKKMVESYISKELIHNGILPKEYKKF